MRVDAHQHYWRIGRNGHEWPTPDLTPIYRDFLPRDLDPVRGLLEVAHTVAVQSQPCDVDTDWLLGLASTTRSIAAVVGWVDLRAATAPDRIATLAQHPRFRGVRPMLQGLPPEWILDPAVEPAIAAMEAYDLVFDALIKPQHLGAIARFAEAHPALCIVIDHAAKPDIAAGMREPWTSDMAAIAALPNVSCKLSGLVTQATADWKIEDLRFYVAHLIECFGAERLLWGSDWPVLLLADSYAGWLDTAEQLLAHLPGAERDAILGGNAMRVYRIK